MAASFPLLLVLASLAWADEIGVEAVLNRLTQLYEEYGEDRYRPSPLLRRMAREGKSFY